MTATYRAGARWRAPGRAALLSLVLACALAGPALADTNPAPPECTAGQIKVTPGAWFPTGVTLNQGDAYSVTATGYMWFSTSNGKPNTNRDGEWGPDGHADPLGFGGANGLKAEIEGSGNDSTDVGSRGGGTASRSGQLVVGEARAYQPNPDGKKNISGWYCVTVSTPNNPGQGTPCDLVIDGFTTNTSAPLVVTPTNTVGAPAEFGGFIPGTGIQVFPGVFSQDPTNLDKPWYAGMFLYACPQTNICTSPPGDPTLIRFHITQEGAGEAWVDVMLTRTR